MKTSYGYLTTYYEGSLELLPRQGSQQLQQLLWRREESSSSSPFFLYQCSTAVPLFAVFDNMAQFTSTHQKWAKSLSATINKYLKLVWKLFFYASLKMVVVVFQMIELANSIITIVIVVWIVVSLLWISTNQQLFSLPQPRITISSDLDCSTNTNLTWLSAQNSGG